MGSAAINPRLRLHHGGEVLTPPNSIGPFVELLQQLPERRGRVTGWRGVIRSREGVGNSGMRRKEGAPKFGEGEGEHYPPDVAQQVMQGPRARAILLL